MKTDAQLQHDVLEGSTYTPKSSVKMVVENGWVTRTGDVDWEYQRTTAQQAVQYRMGVTGVISHIARDSAWGMPGVRHVVDNLAIAF